MQLWEERSINFRAPGRPRLAPPSKACKLRRAQVMPDGVEVAKATLIGTDAALSLFVASAPLLSSELVAPLTAVLRKGVPVLGNALAGGLHTVAAACQRLRLQQTLLERRKLLLVVHP
mgnify:CR=1 FL=1